MTMPPPRPPVTAGDIPVTVLFVVMGTMFGWGLIGILMMLYEGLWLLWPVFLFVLMVQLLFEGGARLVWWGGNRLWRKLRSLPPKPPAQSVQPLNEPWLKAKAPFIGMTIGATWLLIAGWSTGTLTVPWSAP